MHQHESYLQHALSPYCEADAKRIFECIGEIRKIPRSGGKTFDFKIKSKNIVLEVTQISMRITFNPSEDQSTKIQKAIKHIGEKESDMSAVRGGVIYYSSIIAFLGNLLERLQDENFIIQEMKKNNLCFILFLPERVSNLNPAELMPSPKLFYVAKVHKTTFVCLDSGIQIIEF